MTMIGAPVAARLDAIDRLRRNDRLAGKIADTFNEIIASNQRMAKQLERVGQQAEQEGADEGALGVGLEGDRRVLAFDGDDGAGVVGTSSSRSKAKPVFSTTSATVCPGCTLASVGSASSWSLPLCCRRR